MSKHTILSLDLNNASDKQRKDFYDHLATYHWQKLAPTTTLWTCVWKEGSTEAGIEQAVRNQTAAAAAVAKVSAYDVTMITGSAPVSWKKP